MATGGDEASSIIIRRRFNPAVTGIGMSGWGEFEDRGSAMTSMLGVVEVLCGMAVSPLMDGRDFGVERCVGLTAAAVGGGEGEAAQGN